MLVRGSAFSYGRAQRLAYLVVAVVVPVLSAGCATTHEGAGHGAAHAPHWSYEGEHGAEHWGDMDPAFSACKLGKAQSPIDLKNAAASSLPELVFAYVKTTATVVNNGHTVQVNFAPGSSIALGGERFELVQMHLHGPSEHTIDGHHSDLELHLVHKSAAGQLAVVGVMLAKGSEVNAAYQTWMASLPHASGAEVSLGDNTVDPAALLPADLSRYSYSGSLTTPPCSEGVRWNILKAPVALGESQLTAFSSLYHDNVRPVQPAGERTIQMN